jgi:arylsulfatase
VIFTADHGEMAGDHGGIRGKGPMAYDGNAHVPLIVVHPDYPRGQSSDVVTSHLDLMPSLPGLAGLAGVPEDQRREAVKGFARPRLFRRAGNSGDRRRASRAPRRPIQLRRAHDH